MNLFKEATSRTTLIKPDLRGHIKKIEGMIIEAYLTGAAVGDIYEIQQDDYHLRAEVVAVDKHIAKLLPFGSASGIQAGALIQKKDNYAYLSVDMSWVGRAINAFGEPLDSNVPLVGRNKVYTLKEPLPISMRESISKQLFTGIRSIDSCIPIGYGQRMGIFAGAGVGKTTLLTHFSIHSEVDVVVWALIGERNREASQMLRLQQDKLSSRTIMVIATSDTSANERIRAAYVAHALAEYFCHHEKKNVLLVLDSITRFAMAQREIGLAIGEPPTQRAYPPSTFSLLPNLVERAGNFKLSGSITAIYSILVESDNMFDPIADCMRSLLDGHIILQRSLAEKNHYPAINILQSLSRLENVLMPENIKTKVKQLKHYLATLEEYKDLIAMGAYQSGSLPELDIALNKRRNIDYFLRQDTNLCVDFISTVQQLHALIQ
jgi:FliI/YscN family ATPase